MKNKRFAALTFSAMLQHGLILLLFGPLLPEMMKTFSVNESAAGFLLGMGSLGFMMGPLLSGALIDKYGARAALLIGFSAEIIFLSVFGFAPVFVLAVAANFFIHLSGAFIETSANVLPTLLPRKHIGSFMSLVHMFFSVGAFIGPFLIGLFLSRNPGAWRPVFFFALIPTGLLLLLSLLTPFPGKKTRQESDGGLLFAHLGATFRNRTILCGALTLLLYVGTEIGISSWIVHYLQKSLGFSKVTASSGLSLLWVGILAGRYINSLLAGRFSTLSLVTASGIGGMLGGILFLLSSDTVVVLLLITWIGLCISGVFPLVMAEINTQDAKRTGVITGVLALGAGAGAMIFQWFIGVVAENVSLTAALAIPIILIALYMSSFFAAVRSMRKECRSE